jgi:tRNA pseudouridine38-40 synthase
MPRYRLTIAYDGTDFCGWQKQEPPTGLNVDPARIMPAMPGDAEGRIVLRTVQQVVEQAVREVVREPVELLGASRTDSGVHARGQVAAFTCESWPASRGVRPLVRAINSRLPDDVLVVDAGVASHDFNPIGGAAAKGYSYTLHISPDRPLWDRRYVHHIWVSLDLARMQEAAALLVGEHDFAAFAAAGHGRQSTVRTVHACAVVECPEAHGHLPVEMRRVRMDISGSGFLWNMVRIIAGTLVEVGRGKMASEGVRRALETGDRRDAGPTLPPTGLCLEWVRYE